MATSSNIAKGLDDDGSAEFVYALLKRKEFKFTSLERHLKVTQGFFPLFGGPAIISVAPATDPDDLEALPSPDSVLKFSCKTLA